MQWRHRSHVTYLSHVSMTSYYVICPYKIGPFPHWVLGIKVLDLFQNGYFYQNRFSQTWKMFAKMCHRLKSENFKSLPHQDTTSVKKRDISFAQWHDLSETRTELLFRLVEKWVFSHSWYWLINSKGLKIISVCHMSYPSFFILMTS